jgi:integrase
MARTINRLTDLAVRKAIKPGLYADGLGLYLRVGPTGGKSWIYRYWHGGKLHDLGLGPLHTIGLALARQRAQRYREQRFVDGVDPLAAKKSTKQAAMLEAAKTMTFEACAKAYIAAHEVGWRNGKHRPQWSSSLTTYVYPILGELSVGAIDTALVMRVIEPIWTAKAETASRVRGRIENILDWAKTRDYRAGENPARWKGHLENLLPHKNKVLQAARAATGRKEHYAAMPYDDLPVFMGELRQRDAATSARALEFVTLTLKRTEEVLGARRREIDRDATMTIFENGQTKVVHSPMWTIPAGRMKGEREHRVPLSAAATQCLSKWAALRAIQMATFSLANGASRSPISCGICKTTWGSARLRRCMASGQAFAIGHRSGAFRSPT